MEAGVTLVFYGVYYGVMGRDCAEMCVDFMAASMTVSVQREGGCVQRFHGYVLFIKAMSGKGKG